MRTALSAVLCWIVLALTAASPAADWPQYRADQQRSGYTPESLPLSPELVWTHQMPHKPAPAWPDAKWQKMTFDFACQPVVAGGRLFYGSSAEGTIHAIDVTTGRERWIFATEGPVRFAPAVWDDRVFAASDDGYLYCLAASDGRLCWKHRGGSSNLSILGNGRLISMFPARGGPVVDDGIVYFGAGLFPTQGFFLHALDAATGKLLWTNDTSGNQRLYQYNHGFCYSNVAAQGYLAVADNTLLVSTGRSIPAAFDKTDGRFLYYNPLEVYRTGGAWLMAADEYVLNGDMAFHVATGAVACPELGVDPNEGPPSSVSPFLRKMPMIEGAVTPQYILVANGREIRAMDRTTPFVDDPRVSQKYATSRTAAFFAGGPRHRLSQHLQGVNLRWTAKVPCTGSLIVAGPRAYAGAKDVVSALDLEKRKIVWTARIEGTAYGLAACDGRLFVSTDAGLLYCFGAHQTQPRAIRPAAAKDAYPDNELYDRAADEILSRTGISEGYCVDLSCGEGQLAYALARKSNLQIYAVEGNPQQVAKARQKLRQAGLYGTRVTIHQRDESDTGYPSRFANLVVSGLSVTRGPDAVPKAEIQRLQRPYGGAVCLGVPGAMKLSVHGPLEGAGSWTHNFGSAANTGTSGDTIARGPLGILWFGTSGPAGTSGGKQRTSAPLFADGRIYIPGAHFLRCLDAYNGRVLWQNADYANRPGRHYMGAHTRGANLCALNDRVYYIDGRSDCVCLDGRTGAELARFTAPASGDNKPGTWGFLASDGGLLFGTTESPVFPVCFEDYCRPLGQPFEAFERTDIGHTEGASLFAMDAATGAVKWTYHAGHLIPHNAVAIGNGRIFLVDRPNLSIKVAEARRRGVTEPVSTVDGALVALDAHDGREVWRSQEDIFGTLLALSTEHDVLVMGFPIMRRGNLASNLFTRLAAHRASDGRRLWSHDVQYHLRPLIVGRTVVIDPGGFDWKTGKKESPVGVPCAYDLLNGRPVMRNNPVTGGAEPWTFGRTEKCSGWTGSPNLLLYRTGTISYYDFLRDEGRSDIGGIRPSCFINVFAAGGMVLAPDNSSGCTCSYLHRTSIAMQPLPQKEHWGLFMGSSPEPGVVRHAAFNIGAIGDRRSPDGNLWLALPRPAMGITTANRVDNRAFVFGAKSVRLELLGPASRRYERMAGLAPRDRPPSSWPGGYSDIYRPESLYQHNTQTTPIRGSKLPWVFTSGLTGPMRLQVDVSRMAPGTVFTVRFYFAELEAVEIGQRVFDVAIGKTTVLKSFDVLRQAGERNKAVVREFTAVAESGKLLLELLPDKGEPIIAGIEVIAPDTNGSQTSAGESGTGIVDSDAS